ncbi:hypothetical protein TNCV_3204801 [Trichonephila clavipes]|nr:hypothetical protein TNCV_3204801 [Trichonephila clavipes]
MSSPGFEPSPYGTAVSIANHSTGWVTCRYVVEIWRVRCQLRLTGDGPPSFESRWLTNEYDTCATYTSPNYLTTPTQAWADLACVSHIYTASFQWY